jgi:hypothetical protein
MLLSNICSLIELAHFVCYSWLRCSFTSETKESLNPTGRVQQSNRLIQHINTIEMKLKSLAIQHNNTIEKVYQSNTLKLRKVHYKFNTTHWYNLNKIVHQSWVRRGDLAFMSALSRHLAYASFTHRAFSRFYDLSSFRFSLYSSHFILHCMTK